MEGEVVLITGGSSGIGLSTARLFAGKGARVWLTARNEEKLARAAASIPHPVEIIPADVTDRASLQTLAETLRTREGKLDVLINSAGQLELSDAADAAEMAERLIRVNYLGPVFTVAATLPLIRLGSRRSIVTLSSFVGKLTPPSWSAYAASKHALQSYCHALRQELAAEGIHVGIVLPGPVESPMTEDLLRTPMYPVPFGVPVLTPDRVSQAILESVLKRHTESTVPGHFSGILRLAAAFPRLVDLVYRRFR